MMLRTFPRTPSYNKVCVIYCPRDSMMVAIVGGAEPVADLGDLHVHTLGKVPDRATAQKIADAVDTFPVGGPLNALDCAFSRWIHGHMEDAQ